MSDRLKDLQRQRELAQQQAAALEREIAKEMNAGATPVANPTPTAPTPPAAPAGADTHADELIERYAPKEKPLHDQVKQGCLIYLALAFGAVGLCILALYIYHHLK